MTVLVTPCLWMRPFCLLHVNPGHAHCMNCMKHGQDIHLFINTQPAYPISLPPHRSVHPSLPNRLCPTLFTQILCPVLSAQPSPSNPLSSTLFTQLSLPNPLCPNLSAQVWASTAVICIGLIGIPQLHCMPRVYSMDIPSDGCPHMSITLVVLRYTHTRSLYFAHSHYGNGVHTHVMVWPLTM